MEIKTVALDREAYDLLRKRKRKDESFSEVVKRLARAGRPISEYAGMWRKHMSEKDIEEIREALRRGREGDKDRMAKLIKRLG